MAMCLLCVQERERISNRILICTPQPSTPIVPSVVPPIYHDPSRAPTIVCVYARKRLQTKGGGEEKKKKKKKRRSYHRPSLYCLGILGME